MPPGTIVLRLPARSGWAATASFAGVGGAASQVDSDIGIGRAQLRKVVVSVVIPALNEAQNLPYVLPRIPADVGEVILVDGESDDDTIQVARNLMPSIRIVHQQGRGKGAALRCGFAAATGDIIVHLDADGSTDPAEIPAFVGALLAGADYAKGTRFIQGAGTSDITLLRRVGNWGFVELANLMFGTQFSDITYGYNAVWRQHRDKLAPEIDGWAHEIVGNIRAARHGLRVVEVASRESARLGGQAKLKTFSAGWAILLAIVAERFRSLPPPSPWTDAPALAAQVDRTAAMAVPIQLQLIDEPGGANKTAPSVRDTEVQAAHSTVAIPIVARDPSHRNGRPKPVGASLIAAMPPEPGPAQPAGSRSSLTADRSLLATRAAAKD
ncbi:MAG: glycosyltransferase family 2 protein [Chloroflexota bacterium]